MSWEDGYSHYCTECGLRWTDADGGCACMYCAVCNSVTDECELMDFDDMCQECFMTSCMECGMDHGCVVYFGRLLCPDCYRWCLNGQ